MPSRRNLSQPEIEEESGGTCAECGGPLQLVRPGKWQCPRAPHDTTEVLPVSPELAALFARHGVVNQARRADEFTPEDYAAYTSLTANEAARVLKDDFAAGKLTRRRWGKSFLYRFADGGK